MPGGVRRRRPSLRRDRRPAAVRRGRRRGRSPPPRAAFASSVRSGFERRRFRSPSSSFRRAASTSRRRFASSFARRVASSSACRASARALSAAAADSSRSRRSSLRFCSRGLLIRPEALLLEAKPLPLGLAVILRRATGPVLLGAKALRLRLTRLLARHGVGPPRAPPVPSPPRAGVTPPPFVPPARRGARAPPHAPAPWLRRAGVTPRPSVLPRRRDAAPPRAAPAPWPPRAAAAPPPAWPSAPPAGAPHPRGDVPPTPPAGAPARPFAPARGAARLLLGLAAGPSPAAGARRPRRVARAASACRASFSARRCSVSSRALLLRFRAKACLLGSLGLRLGPAGVLRRLALRARRLSSLLGVGSCACLLGPLRLLGCGASFTLCRAAPCCVRAAAVLGGAALALRRGRATPRRRSGATTPARSSSSRRSSIRRIFPSEVLGSSVTNSISRGCAYARGSRRACRRSSSASPSVASRPARRTTNAFTGWPGRNRACPPQRSRQPPDGRATRAPPRTRRLGARRRRSRRPCDP